MGWRVAVFTELDRQIWVRHVRRRPILGKRLREDGAVADFRDADLMLHAQHHPHQRLIIYAGPRPVAVRGRHP